VNLPSRAWIGDRPRHQAYGRCGVWRLAPQRNIERTARPPEVRADDRFVQTMEQQSIEATGIRLPDFLVIGGSKCGTVWINDCLREHPDVYLTSDTHEVFFFDRYFDRGTDWYARYFRGYAGERRIGEITSSYLADERAPARVRSVLPGATLIASLRNPIDRAWSKYLDLWRKGRIPGVSDFWEACRVAPEILADGEYFRCLEPWRRLFPPEQIHLLVLDDALMSPRGFLRRIYELLEVDKEFVATKTTDRANEHRTPRSAGAARVAYRWAAFLHRHGLHGPVELAKRFGLERVVLHGGRDARKDPGPLSDSDRSRLRQHYRSDVASLSELVGRDLVSAWLQGG
jgi:hypothetical protein